MDAAHLDHAEARVPEALLDGVEHARAAGGPAAEENKHLCGSPQNGARDGADLKLGAAAEDKTGGIAIGEVLHGSEENGLVRLRPMHELSLGRRNGRRAAPERRSGAPARRLPES